MTLGNKMSITPPEGYDPKLWASIPSVRAQLHPGKHDIYIFGQNSADGTACIGCSWQTHELLEEKLAISVHDEAMKLDHDHAVWVSKPSRHCPCGKEDENRKIDKIKAEGLREFYAKIHGHYALNFGSAEELYKHISYLLIRDAELLEG